MLAFNDAWRRTRDGNERPAPQDGQLGQPPNSDILVLLHGHRFCYCICTRHVARTCPTGSANSNSCTKGGSGGVPPRRRKRRSSTVPCPCVSAQKFGRRNSLRTETSSPSRNKVFQTGRVLFHLIPYVRSKSSGASKRGRGRPRWPKDTTNLIDLVRFQGPLKVHRQTRASGLERALFHNVVYFETRKFDHLGAGFLGLSGIYCAMPAWR
jgi:hypothetical protein